MTEYILPYGHEHLAVQLPEKLPVDILVPASADVLPDPDLAINQALDTPLGNLNPHAYEGAQTVGIAINDKTRPVPKPNPVQHLLNLLGRLGFEPQQITLFVASGTHAPMQADELPQILDQEILNRYPIIVHDSDHSPTVDLGMSTWGNPIQINADFHNCDLKISVGNIEPHHFMGYSGGVKTAAIGLASRATIAANHAKLTHPQARTGVYHLNPLRQEVEEIGRKAGINYSLGTILNEEKQILEVYYGEPTAVMNKAIPVIRRLFGFSVPSPFDLVIASPGGAPKDINLYQSQKALTHAARITRDDGWVILLAACPEGSGSQTFEDYVKKAKSNQAILEQFQKGYFQVGPHKAMLIARDAVRVKVVLVSDQPPQVVNDWKLTPSKPELINELISWIATKLPSKARAAILPAATRTMTEVKN